MKTNCSAPDGECARPSVCSAMDCCYYAEAKKCRAEAERKAKDREVPKHLTEGITEEDITDADRALVKDFYENCCHAEWCEYDEALLLYAVVRARLGAKSGG